jgi:peptidoglycan/LPS O-acetylase OafA/YrhL
LAAAVLLWSLFVWKELDSGAIGLLAIAAFLAVGSCVLPLSRDRVMAVLEWRPLAVLGIASYSLYVLHVPIVNWLSKKSIAGTGGLHLVRFGAVAVPLCCAVALLSYAVIERPFLRLRRRWVDPRGTVAVDQPSQLTAPVVPAGAEVEGAGAAT